MAPLGPYAKDVCPSCGVWIAITKAGVFVKHTCATVTLFCSECGESKPLEDFYADNTRPRGHVSRCKECYNKRRLADRKKPWRRYSEAKSNADKRDIAFKITRQEYLDLFWDKPCYYCGFPACSGGLDRLNNKGCYDLENTVPCCGTCNQMKSDLPLEVFIDHCRRIAINAQGVFKAGKTYDYLSDGTFEEHVFCFYCPDAGYACTRREGHDGPHNYVPNENAHPRWRKEVKDDGSEAPREDPGP